MFCVNCGQKISGEHKFCSKCGKKIKEEKTDNKKIKKDKHEGLSGWLILVAITLILTPVLYILNLFTIEWSNLSIHGEGFQLYIIMELVFGAVFSIIAIYLLILFKNKKEDFPKYYIWFLVFVVIFTIVDFSAMWQNMKSVDSYARLECIFSFNKQVCLDLASKNFNNVMYDYGRDIGRSVLFALIWIPYMRVSKRVKATFIK